MPLLPYCVFLSESNEPQRTGVQGRDVLRLDVRGLSVIYSNLGKEQIAGDQFQAAALKFHEVVHAVFGERAVIPFRFPTLLTEGELRDHLEKESARYRTFLQSYAEDVQMEVRLWIPETLQQKPSSGTEYMHRGMNRLMNFTSASHYVQRVATDIAREWQSHDSRESVRLFALVPRSRIKEFRELFTDNPRPAKVAMRVTGPWPATEFFAGSSTPTPHNVVSITRGEKS